MKNKFGRILIIGNGASGKTTLSLTLSSILKAPILHLDNIYWIEGWNKNELLKFENQVCDFMKSDHWIIEGTPMHAIESRMENADTIIFLDLSRHTCIFRFIKRALKNILFLPKNSDAGCPAKFFSPKALAWIGAFKNSKRKTLINLLEKNKEKNIFYIRKKCDLKKLLQTIENTIHTHASVILPSSFL